MARPRQGSITHTKNGLSVRITVNLHTSGGIVPLQPSFDAQTTSRTSAKLTARRLSETYADGVKLTDESGFAGVLKELRAAYTDVESAKAAGDKATIAKMEKRLDEAQSAVREVLNDRAHKALKDSLFTSGRTEAKELETFTKAMERVVPEQGKEGFATWQDRRSRLRRYACPELGEAKIDKIGVGDIRALLRSDLVRESLSKTTVGHLRNDLVAVFGWLREEGLIPTNPAEGMKLPGNLREDERPRVVLDDDEFEQFMACPDVSPILALKAASSRMFGGMRTSDLHAWDWSHFDLVGWRAAKVYRPKTQGKVGEAKLETELVTLVIHEPLRSMLYGYWIEQGKPAAGPVFPVLKGDRVGERQGKRSHARELRAALWVAGVHHPLPGFDAAMDALGAIEAELARARADNAKGQVRELQRARLAAEEAAQALDVIQAGGPMFKRADFHSFRRAFNTGLAAAGLNVQQAMALAGQRDARTHMRYVKLNQRGALETPAAALPRVSASPLLKPGSPEPPPITDLAILLR